MKDWRDQRNGRPVIKNQTRIPAGKKWIPIAGNLLGREKANERIRQVASA